MPPPGAEILPMPPEPAAEYDTEDDEPEGTAPSDPPVSRKDLCLDEQIKLGLADETLARWPLNSKLAKLKPHERHPDNPFHEPIEAQNQGKTAEYTPGEQYIPTEAELARYENELSKEKKDGGILKKDSDDDENQKDANLTADWADAPTDFSAIPAPFKEKGVKKVKFSQGADEEDSKKDNKKWKKEQRLKIQMRKESKGMGSALGRTKGTWKQLGADEDEGSEQEVARKRSP